jgi:hypothetical protein
VQESTSLRLPVRKDFASRPCHFYFTATYPL